MLRFTPILLFLCGLAAGCGNSATGVADRTIAHAEETQVAPEANSQDAPPLVVEEESAPSPEETELPRVEMLKTQLQELAEMKLARAELPEEFLESSVPAPDPQSQPRPQPVSLPQPEEVAMLRAEIADLREDVDRLQETVDAALAYLVGELSRENRKLRTDLAEANVPVSEPLTETAPVSEPEPPEPVLPPPAPTPAKHVDYGKAGYIAIKEWGRTPELAAELSAQKPGETVASLRGMICAVSPDVSDAELRAIGKRIRESCAGYDNINIDIFNDETAARAFADNNIRSSKHLVMNITRHKATGQDVMVRIHEDGKREVVVE